MSGIPEQAVPGERREWGRAAVGLGALGGEGAVGGRWGGGECRGLVDAKDWFEGF